MLYHSAVMMILRFVVMLSFNHNSFLLLNNIKHDVGLLSGMGEGRILLKIHVSNFWNDRTTTEIVVKSQ